MKGDAETKSVQNVAEVKAEEAVAQKLEEIKLEVDENPETSPKLTDQMKRGSLSKFFRFKKSSSSYNVSGEAEAKVNKSSTLMRLFNKKKDDKEKEETRTEDSSHGFFMRGIINSHLVPWIGRRSSQMNIHEPIVPVQTDDDDNTPHEIATASQLF